MRGYHPVLVAESSWEREKFEIEPKLYALTVLSQPADKK